jgi:hypothetical protein
MCWANESFLTRHFSPLRIKYVLLAGQTEKRKITQNRDKESTVEPVMLALLEAGLVNYNCKLGAP